MILRLLSQHTTYYTTANKNIFVQIGETILKTHSEAKVHYFHKKLFDHY